MKEMKFHPALTIIGSILLVLFVLGAVVYVRASKETEADRALADDVKSSRKIADQRSIPSRSHLADRSSTPQSEQPWWAAVPGLASFVQEVSETDAPAPPPATRREAIVRTLIDAALEQTMHRVTYDASYVRLAYPGGDVPPDRGVCADVIIRAYRAVGCDLQQLVHEDMRRNFAAYPQNWGAKRPDPNIDHRRVLNLMTFFKRRGAAVSVSAKTADYLPGDVVTWDLRNGRCHVGIVTDLAARASGRPLVVHNIGPGPRAEDVLFAWKITGHYRYPSP